MNSTRDFNDFAGNEQTVTARRRRRGESGLEIR